MIKPNQAIIFLIKKTIRFYQRFISPLFVSHCRFYPTCSQYALESFEQHGLFKGFYLSVKRVLSCNPWHAGGYNPVPAPHKNK